MNYISITNSKFHNQGPNMYTLALRIIFTHYITFIAYCSNKLIFKEKIYSGIALRKMQYFFTENASGLKSHFRLKPKNIIFSNSSFSPATLTNITTL